MKTDSNLLNLVVSGTDDQIPQREGAPPPQTVRTYQLSIKRTANGYVSLYYKKQPKDVPAVTPDQPLDLRVPEACQIVLQLDPDIHWSFKPNEDDRYAVSLGTASADQDPPTSRYYNFSYDNPKQVSFCADYGDTDGNRDSINIYVYLEQIMANGDPANSVPIAIDPDIKNPGDPQNAPPG